MVIRSLILFFIIFFCFSFGYAANCGLSPSIYFVDYVSGNDANEGTSTSIPWQHAPGDAGGSWHDSNCTLQAGDKIIFKGDVTYVGAIVIGSSGNADTVAGRIIFDGDSGTYATRWGSGADKAKIDCNLAAKCINLNGKSYITLNSLEIYHGSVTKADNPALIYESGTSNSYFTVTNCILHDVGNHDTNDTFCGACLEIQAANYADVSYNTLYNCNRESIMFWPGGSQSNGAIHHNTITDITNWAIAIAYKNMTGASTNWQIYNNTVYNIQYYSTEPHNFASAHLNFIWLYGNSEGTYPVDGIKIYNNTLYNTGVAQASSGAIHLEPYSGEFTNVMIYNNVMKNIGGANSAIAISGQFGNYGDVYVYNNSISSGSPAISIAQPGTYDSVTIKNNIFNTSSWIYTIDPSVITTLVIDNNLYYYTGGSGTPFVCDSSFKNWANFKTCTGNAETNSIGISTDPLFVNVSGDNHDLRLQGASTAINAGATLASPYDIDALGVTRPQGSAWDIGAYEFMDRGGSHNILKPIITPPHR